MFPKDFNIFGCVAIMTLRTVFDKDFLNSVAQHKFKLEKETYKIHFTYLHIPSRKYFVG